MAAGKMKTKQTKTPDYVPEDRRIKDCNAARELWKKVEKANERRTEIMAQVRNQMAGGRPMDPNALIENGEGWRTNNNFRDAEAAFQRAFLPFYKMLNDVPRKMAIKIRERSPNVNQWEIAMAEAADMFIEDKGPDYYMFINGVIRDFVMHGPGYFMWEDAEKPMPQWLTTTQVYFPSRASTNVCKWEMVCVKRDMTVSELWEKIKPEVGESAEYAGWNSKAVKAAMKICAPPDFGFIDNDANRIQDAVNNNDLAMSGIWTPLQVVDMFVKKDGKKISHYIFTEKDDVKDYLYEGEEYTDDFAEMLNGIFYDIGDNGLIHGVKGFGVRNYYHAQEINSFKCRLVDAAKFSMGMNFVRQDDAPDEQPPVENYGMINVFPKGINQLQYFPNLQQAENIVGLLKANQDENNFTYNDTSTKIGDTETAKQAEILASIGQEMTSSVSTVFLSQVGRNIFTEIVRRLRIKGSKDEDAKKFQKRCIKLGVPPEVIHDSEIIVTTGASPNMASPMMREQIANLLMTQIYPLPDANRRAILEFRTANLVGSDGISQFLLPAGSNSAPQSRTKARVENTSLGQGIELFADPSESHYEEADEHLLPLENIIQSAGQNAQLAPEHMVALQFGLAHTAQHVQFLSQDTVRRDQFKEINARFQNVNSAAMGIVQRLQALKDKQMTQSADVSPEQVIAATQGPAR